MGVPLDSSRKGNVDIFVTIKTDKAGVIKGESADTSHPDEILVTGWAWGMSSVSDASTGLATGRRQHKPLKLFKSIDSATCPLAIALSQNQAVKELKLTCRKAGSGASLEYLVITLKSGRVSRLDLEYDETTGGTGREVAEITYQEIQIDYTPQSTGGTSSATRTFIDALNQQR